MNRIFLIGNLTRDPELGHTATQVAFCRFSIAVNREYKDAEGQVKTDFFDCTAWRGTAETVANYCKKGKKVCVVGRMETSDFVDKDGNKRKLYSVNVEDVEFLTPRSAEEAAEYAATHQVPVQKTQANKGQWGQYSKFDDLPDANDLSDSDIPF